MRSNIQEHIGALSGGPLSPWLWSRPAFREKCMHRVWCLARFNSLLAWRCGACNQENSAHQLGFGPVQIFLLEAQGCVVLTRADFEYVQMLKCLRNGT